MRFYRQAILQILVASLPALASATTLSGPSGTLGGQNFALNASAGYAVRDMVPDQGPAFTYSTKRMVLQGLYGISHYINVFGNLGVADQKLKDGGADFQSPLSSYFGGGLRFAMLPREQAMQVHLDAQLGYFSTEDNNVKVDNLEYRVAAYARMRQETAAFFGGLEYTDVMMDVDGNDARADDVLGVFFGGEAFVSPNVFFNAELHIFDMQAVFVGVGYRL